MLKIEKIPTFAELEEHYLQLQNGLALLTPDKQNPDEYKTLADVNKKLDELRILIASRNKSSRLKIGTELKEIEFKLQLKGILGKCHKVKELFDFLCKNEQLANLLKSNPKPKDFAVKFEELLEKILDHEGAKRATDQDPDWRFIKFRYSKSIRQNAIFAYKAKIDFENLDFEPKGAWGKVVHFTRENPKLSIGIAATGIIFALHFLLKKEKEAKKGKGARKALGAMVSLMPGVVVLIASLSAKEQKKLWEMAKISPEEQKKYATKDDEKSDKPKDKKNVPEKKEGIESLVEEIQNDAKKVPSGQRWIICLINVLIYQIKRQSHGHLNTKETLETLACYKSNLIKEKKLSLEAIKMIKSHASALGLTFSEKNNHSQFSFKTNKGNKPKLDVTISCSANSI